MNEIARPLYIKDTGCQFDYDTNDTQEYYCFEDGLTHWTWQVIRNKAEEHWWAVVMQPGADGRMSTLSDKVTYSNGVVHQGPLYGLKTPEELVAGMVKLIHPVGHWPKHVVTEPKQYGPKVMVNEQLVENLARQHDIMTLLRAAAYERELTFAILVENMLGMDDHQAARLADNIGIAIGLTNQLPTYGWTVGSETDPDREKRRYQQGYAVINRFPWAEDLLVGRDVHIYLKQEEEDAHIEIWEENPDGNCA